MESAKAVQVGLAFFHFMSGDFIFSQLFCSQADADSENRGPASTEKYGKVLRSLLQLLFALPRNSEQAMPVIPNTIKYRVLELLQLFQGEISIEFGEVLKDRHA